MPKQPPVYDPKNYGKPQIRVPSDADHGPNPYDSKTGLQAPIWMTAGFWFQIIGIAVVVTIAAIWRGNS